jgi:hypothetical protein
MMDERSCGCGKLQCVDGQIEQHTLHQMYSFHYFICLHNNQGSGVAAWAKERETVTFAALEQMRWSIARQPRAFGTRNTENKLVLGSRMERREDEIDVNSGDRVRPSWKISAGAHDVFDERPGEHFGEHERVLLV